MTQSTLIDDFVIEIRLPGFEDERLLPMNNAKWQPDGRPHTHGGSICLRMPDNYGEPVPLISYLLCSKSGEIRRIIAATAEELVHRLARDHADDLIKGVPGNFLAKLAFDLLRDNLTMYAEIMQDGGFAAIIINESQDPKTLAGHASRAHLSRNVTRHIRQVFLTLSENWRDYDAEDSTASVFLKNNDTKNWREYLTQQISDCTTFAELEKVFVEKRIENRIMDGAISGWVKWLQQGNRAQIHWQQIQRLRE